MIRKSYCEPKDFLLRDWRKSWYFYVPMNIFKIILFGIQLISNIVSFTKLYVLQCDVLSYIICLQIPFLLFYGLLLGHIPLGPFSPVSLVFMVHNDLSLLYVDLYGYSILIQFCLLLS